MMAAWGRFVYRRRLLVLGLSLLVAALSVAAFLGGGNLNDNQYFDFESGRANQLIGQQLPGGVQFTLLMASPNLTYDDPKFQAAAEAAIAPLKADSADIADIETPYLVPNADAAAQALAATQISNDSHAIVVTVQMRGTAVSAGDKYDDIRSMVHSDTLKIQATGDLAVIGAYNDYSKTDLAKSDVFSAPSAGILLLLVFGTLVACLLCLGVGGLAVLGGLGGVYTLAHFTDISSYAVNICALVGLGVAIDYSLFMASRFREELARGLSVEKALENTMAHAGRAIFFSGLTVAIGLAGLLFYRGIFLPSLGLAGAVVVVFAVLYALTFLPAVLALLGHRVNWLSLPRLWRPKPGAERRGFWSRVARFVMKRPVTVLIPAAALLIMAGTPFPHLHLISNDVQQLPATSEVRLADTTIRNDFPNQGSSTMVVILNFSQGKPTDAQNVATSRIENQRLSALKPHVVRVESYIDILNIYPDPTKMPATVQKVMNQITGSSIALFNVVTDLDSQSTGATDLLTSIRSIDKVDGATAQVTGTTAFNVDFVGFIIDHTPAAIIFVMAVTFVVLTFLLRSLILPIKAVLMNLLSLSAAFGAMVWAIQDGHLSGVLGFDAAPIDPTLPPIMFCLVFGLSMDYEVFLLSRMQESYRRNADNARAVADGLQASGRLVTGAAAIMVAVFASFALAAQEVVIKAVGVGLATAILVDATLVRALVVPALMRLLGDVNWWCPRWLKRIIPEPAPEPVP